MPNPSPIIPFILLFCLNTISAMQIEGRYRNGLSFRGDFVVLENALLVVRFERGSESISTGIPLTEVKWIRPTKNLEGEPFLETMEALLPLLPAWDPGLIQQISVELENLAANSQWHRLHYWTQHLEAWPRNGQTGLSLRVLQAWALLEMNLIQQADIILEEILQQIDPIMAPPRFCWLKARVALENGQFRAAYRWAILPSLRIPRATDEDIEMLGTILQSIENTELLDHANRPSNAV